MTRNFRYAASARARTAFCLNLSGLRWKLAHAALLASVSGGVLAVDHARHELAPTVITGVAPAAGVTVATDPKIPRQPVTTCRPFPASPPYEAAAPTPTRCSAACSARA